MTKCESYRRWVLGGRGSLGTFAFGHLPRTTIAPKLMRIDRSARKVEARDCRDLESH